MRHNWKRLAWLQVGLISVVAWLLASPAWAQHAGGCACGRNQNSHAQWEIDHVSASFSSAAAAEFQRWHTYIDPFFWVTGDNFGGPNGRNEIIFFGVDTVQSLYGMNISEFVFGVTYINPESAFGNPPFNACPPPAGVTCGSFTETDVIMNADFTRGWTTAPPNFNDDGPANYGATALHELGHGLGLHHNFDNLSTMNYFEDFAARYLARADARIARIHYPNVVQGVSDIATYPFRYSGIGDGYNSTLVASPSPTSVPAGAGFTLRDFTVENIGPSTLSNVRLHLYLSSNSIISTSDYLLGILSWSSFSTWWDTSGIGLTVPSSVPAGTYYIGALIFYNTDQSDSVTYNNEWVLDSSRRLTVTNPPAPDLIVQSPSVSDSSLSPGESFTIFSTAFNQGSGSSSSTTMRYYRSLNSIISSLDTELGTDAVSGLSPGGSSPESIAVTAPGDGIYWVGACVDAVAGEINTANNCSSGVQITVMTPAPDLIVNTFQPGTPPPYQVGQNVEWQALLENVGDATSNSTRVGFYLGSSCSDLSNRVDSSPVPSLGAGGLDIASRHYTFAAQDAGSSKFMVAFVDYENSEPNESSETNNTQCIGPFSVAAVPDLIVHSIGVNDSTPNLGEQFTASATVQNQGGGASSGTTLRYYRSTDSTINGSDTQIGVDSVPGLSAGGQSAQSELVSSGNTPGLFWVGACADSVSGESPTTNNCSSGVPITVGIPGCTPPASGDWVIAQECLLAQNASAPADVIVNSNVTLTIAADVILELDAPNHRLRILAGGKVIFNKGGKIQ